MGVESPPESLGTRLLVALDARQLITFGSILMYVQIRARRTFLLNRFLQTKPRRFRHDLRYYACLHDDGSVSCAFLSVLRLGCSMWLCRMAARMLCILQRIFFHSLTILTAVFKLQSMASALFSVGRAGAFLVN